jgi:ubiquinone/menaquinone biosynthesis C-methylase UbiE
MPSAAGLYERRVFPWLNDRLNADPELVRLRAEAMAAAKGRTLEIGFGTGLNLAHYPAAVSELVAIEPNEGMLDRATDRITAVKFPVKVIHATAETLPLTDRTIDTAVSVLTLCTVDEPARVLGELHRVLRDEGCLIVLEHGLAEIASVVKWQMRLDWLQGKLACGCHLTRPIAELLSQSGFRFESVRQFFVPKMPRTHGWVTVGVATKV